MSISSGPWWRSTGRFRNIRVRHSREVPVRFCGVVSALPPCSARRSFRKLVFCDRSCACPRPETPGSQACKHVHGPLRDWRGGPVLYVARVMLTVAGIALDNSSIPGRRRVGLWSRAESSVTRYPRVNSRHGVPTVPPSWARQRRSRGTFERISDRCPDPVLGKA